MQPLKELSAKQLNVMLNQTQAELKRRNNIEKARLEVQSIIKKYNITMDDINVDVDSKRQQAPKTKRKKTGKTKVVQKKKPGATNTKQVNQKVDKRAAVAAKYKNPNTNEKWSGRGRTPSWVAEICEKESIDVSQFKSDPRFTV